jgi:hypothetical protein
MGIKYFFDKLVFTVLIVYDYKSICDQAIPIFGKETFLKLSASYVQLNLR